MLKQLLRCISTLLVLVLLINMLPVQALGELTAESSVEKTVTESPAAESGNIITELPEDRDTYTKQFLLDNGNTMAVQYAIAVHSRWKPVNLFNHKASTVSTVATVAPQTYGLKSNLPVAHLSYTSSNKGA